MLLEIKKFLEDSRAKGLLKCSYISYGNDSVSISESFDSPVVVFDSNKNVYIYNQGSKTCLKEQITIIQALRLLSALFVK